jgi:phosphotransferase system HPr-like phosphotransfer protein
MPIPAGQRGIWRVHLTIKVIVQYASPAQNQSGIERLAGELLGAASEIGFVTKAVTRGSTCNIRFRPAAERQLVAHLVRIASGLVALIYDDHSFWRFVSTVRSR